MSCAAPNFRGSRFLPANGWRKSSCGPDNRRWPNASPFQKDRNDPSYVLMSPNLDDVCKV